MSYTYKNSIDELNTEQKEAVLQRGHTQVIAGPGSGKTKMLATKAAMLLSESEDRIGAVTFSKESAIELQHRIKLLCSSDASKRLFVGTFHSLCYKALMNRLDIVNDGLRSRYVKLALEVCEVEMRVKDAMMLIDGYKSQGIKPIAGSADAELYGEYQKLLDANRQMDFSDILLNSVKELEAGTSECYPVAHLLVDEFQDCDPIQLRWIMAHVKNGTTVTVVGDDDQSIYKFRSAMGYEGMQRFLMATNAVQIVLTQNYRCRAEVLNGALNSIRHNTQRIPKTINAVKGAGGFFKEHILVDPESEAQFIIDSIGDVKKGSHAVLSRNNVDLDLVECFFRSAGVPYFRPNDKSLFDYPEVAMYFGLIELIANIKKDVGIDSLFQFIHISSEDRKILNNLDIGHIKKLPKSELMNHGVSDEGAMLYRSFATYFAEWQSLNERTLYSLLINGAVEWVCDRLPPKMEFRKQILISASIALDRLTGDMASRLRFLKEKKNNEPEEHAVRLLTLHSSKGLEFDEVYIIRAETSICPSDKSPIDEERRLFYVGATRAKERLHVTMTQKNKASCFVAEMHG